MEERDPMSFEVLVAEMMKWLIILWFGHKRWAHALDLVQLCDSSLPDDRRSTPFVDPRHWKQNAHSLDFKPEMDLIYVLRPMLMIVDFE